MAVNISTISPLIVFLALISFGHFSHGQLQLGFYAKSCPTVEETVFRVVQERFKTNSALAPQMIRLYFHDCFSNGCDASLLLDGDTSEKKAPPNLSVRGYELIDEVRSELEKECKGVVVSCADIIALATRDLVTLASGGKTKYEIPTGRFDGRESLASSVDLPSPQMTVFDTFKMFEKRKLSLSDMVLLLGGHTIGVANCSFIMDRLYNFENTQEADPSMDSNLVKELRVKCPKGSANGVINLDQDVSSSNIVDVSFYKQINSRRGILRIDQQLADDKMTSKMVMDLAKGNDFLTKFGQAMVNLGSVGVKNKDNGEIRRSCRSCNKLFCLA